MTEAENASASSGEEMDTESERSDKEVADGGMDDRSQDDSDKGMQLKSK